MSFIGRYTGYDLRNITPLYAPWAARNGLLQPVFSKEAAMLSLELAASAYDMDLDAWREAGWRDISYQVDNTLLTGPGVNGDSSGPIGSVVSDYYERLAKARLHRQNPISQIRGTLRQRESSDTCKSVVMLHALPGGHYLAAIGFMGTGKRLYDWISNFRVSREDGVHTGFLQLTKQFEGACDQIVFPETARELGLDKLTLSDVLQECRRPGSRFRLWMAGHSQGAAIMQLMAYREIEKGFLRQNMIGYGFASPSVIYDPPACDVSAFPLFHIINADDIFPRTGAALHFGRCRIFYPDDKMRAACYGESWQRPQFRDMLRLTRNVTCSRQAFLLLLAVFQALQAIPQEEAAVVLNSFIGSVIPEMLLPAVSAKGEDVLRLVIGRIRQGYALASGQEEPPEEELRVLRERMKGLLSQYGGKDFAKAFSGALGLPHKLRSKLAGNGAAPYQYIATERFDELRHRIWCAPANRVEHGRRAGTRRMLRTRWNSPRRSIPRRGTF